MMILIIGLSVVLAFAAFVRLRPITKIPVKGGPVDLGTHVLPGGVKVVLPGTSQLGDLIARIKAQPRTTMIADGCYVVRSRLWGFPDVVRVWTQDGNTHIWSHLVYGRSDLGQNCKRVQGWIDAV